MGTAALMPEESFKLIRSRGVGYAVAGFSRACLIRLIDFPEMPLRVNTHETVKVGRTALVIRTQFDVGNKQTPVAYKRVRRRNRWKVLTALFRTNRLLRAWKLGREFRSRNIPTPRPLAVIVPRWYQFGHEAYLASEWIDGSENLRNLTLLNAGLEPHQRHQIARGAAITLGRLLGGMHEAHVSHRDLKATNLLLRCTRERVDAYVIDLDGAKLHGPRVPWNVRLHNLSRLEASIRELPAVQNTDRLRLLKAYLESSAPPVPAWKTTWRELAELADAHTLRKQRRAA